MVTEFTQNIIRAIQEVPKGKVSTYGEIAKQAGNHRGARQVARVLHTLTAKHNLPWHRIVNKEGRIAVRSQEGISQQKMLLKKEGIVLKKDKIDLKKHGHKPLPPDIKEFFG